MKKTASKKSSSFLKYIGMAVGVVLLSGWMPKTAVSEISHKTEIQKHNVIEITGVVTTEYGDPIPGVTILIVGTNQGTSTDLEGKYTLTSKQGDEVQFVFPDFKTITITVSENNVFNITMIEDLSELEEVVLNAYYESHKEEVLRCVAGFSDSRTIEDYAVGLNVPTYIYAPENNRRPEVLLKDVEALTRNMELTYIVDGIRVSEETFRSLNQNDIESIDIHRHTDMYNARFGNTENLNKRTLRNR